MAGRGTSKRLPRHLRNEDIPRNTFTPRTYQVELLDSALERNTMVCMGSSTGRRFIAVMLLKEMALDIRKPLDKGGKRTFFLVSSDESAEHHSSSVEHPVDFHVRVCTEQLGVSSWSKQKWQQELTQWEAFILTGSVFLRLLQDGIVTLDIINLLILDDCHLVLQTDHPYRDIMDCYKSMTASNKPRILGLTSNILEGKFQNPDLLGDLINSLEEALQSVAETSSLVIPERYGITPTETIIECNDYEDTTGLNVQLYAILESAIDFLDECNIDITEELDNRDPRLIAKAALIECHNILSQLGPWCASCLADMLVTQIDKIEKQKETVALHKKFLKFGATTLRMVSKLFEEHFKQCEYSLEDLLTYTTPKVAELMNSLRKYRPKTDFVIISEDLDSEGDGDMGSDMDMSDVSDFSDNNDDDDDADDVGNKSPSSKQIHVAVKKISPDDDKTSDPFALEEEKNLCGIVFVNYQHEAYALNKFIEEACAWDEELCFVKSCHLTGNKSSNKKEKLYQRQENTLRKFRMQELNLLVSTNVLEEGVDVPKCNFVVRFDAPKTYKSYSHSKGRARARDGDYLILVEGEHYDEFQTELKIYHQIEKVLIRRSRRTPDEDTSPNGTCACDSPIEPYVPSSEESSLRVTLDSAIMLVNRYCAKLPSDAFTHLTPACTLTEVEQDGQIMYTATLRLPINSPVKEVVEGVPMSTKLKAKQAVALKMCKILHQRGELDDSLMPVGKEMFEKEEEEDIWEEEEDVYGEARPGTTKRKQYYCKRVASYLQETEPQEGKGCYLYVINMRLTGPITEDQNTRGRKLCAPEDTPRCFGILTTKMIPLVPLFPVFTRSGEVTVSIDLLTREVTLTASELSKLRTFHQFLFSNVLRLEKDPLDYMPECGTMGYLVCPLNTQSDSSVLHIDWQFTEKVVESSKSPPKPREPGEPFVFRAEDFEDAVVMPAYRNIDQPQYFYVAEIRSDLNPSSRFPSPELYKTFAEYYATKYGLIITNLEQPLLDVDHTSARLNLLIPRYMNQKGVALPTSSAETKKARRENLQQKQILVPELCDIHVFLASLWRKAVCLPAILYRMNYLLLGEEIRKNVSKETKIGISELPDDYRFPKLDFGIDTSPEHLKQLMEMSSENAQSDVKFSDESVKSNDESAIRNNLASNNENCVKMSANTDEEIDNQDKDSNKPQVKVIDIEGDKLSLSIGEAVNEINIDSLAADLSNKCNLDYLGGSTSTDQRNNRSQNIDSQCNNHTSAIHSAETICDKTHTPADKLNTFHSADADGDINECCKKNSSPYEYRSEKKKNDIRKLGEIEEHVMGINGWDEKANIESPEIVNDESKVNNANKAWVVNGNKDDDENVTRGPIFESTNGSSAVENATHNLHTANADADKKNEHARNGSTLDHSDSDCYDKITKNKISNDADESTKETCARSKLSSLNGVRNRDESLTEKGKTAADEQTEDVQDAYDKNSDIFTNVGKFEMDSKKDINVEDDLCPEPLISLDEDTDLTTFIGPGPCEILQALTMSNANDFFSLERLETIGDSFLKYAITAYLYCSYPGIHEGKLSYLRSKQVSNFNLYRLGKRKGLAECIISTKFEPYENWLPPGYVINDDKRKGPVPKVCVVPLCINKNTSTVYASMKPVSSHENFMKNFTDAPEEINDLNSGVDNFLTELEEADEISKANDEEFFKGDKNEGQVSYIPYSLQLHHCLPDKSIADCMEALIGCYLTSCDKMAALRLMSWMGLKVLPKKKNEDGEVLEAEFDPLPCPPSPFLTHMPGAEKILEQLLDGYEGFEQKIGYTFNDRSYLLQAFTHASYHFNVVTDCYQRLEFLGDAVLDYVITRHLYEDSDKYSPGVLTDLRSALVNNNIFAALAVKWDFHKYFKAISPSLFTVIEKFVSRQKEKEDEIDDENDEADEDHEKEHVELEVPKALGDIFESVAGAIYLDSKMSLDTVWKVFYRIMRPQIDKYLKNIPKSPVRELLEQEPETAKFEKPERTLDGKIRVTVNVVGKGVFTGVGRNYRIAKSAAAKKALRCIRTLEQQGLI